MLEPRDKDFNPGEDYLCGFLTERSKDLVELRKQVESCQDSEISIGNFRYARESVLGKIQQFVKIETDSRISATSMDMFSLATIAEISLDQTSTPAENSQEDEKVIWASKEASLIHLEAGAGSTTMANHDDRSSILQQLNSTDQPMYDVLISRVAALPGSFRRNYKFATTRGFEICAKFSNQDIKVLLQDQDFRPELTVCLSLTMGTRGTNQISCRLIDTGEVIRDYLQDANQLASKANFIVDVLLCDRKLQFENFSLTKICHPEVACTQELSSNYKTENASPYLFKSIALEVSDRVFIELISSISENMTAEVKIQYMQSTSTCKSALYENGPFDHHFEAVFENELLLDKIMKYVIFGETREGENFQSVFAVNKTWRKSACRLTASETSYAQRIEDIEKLIYFTPGGFPLGNVKPYTLIVEGNESASPGVLKFLRCHPPSQLDFIYFHPPNPTQEVLYNEVLFETLENTIDIEISQRHDDDKNISVENLQRILNMFRKCKRLFLRSEIDIDSEPRQELNQSELKLPASVEDLNWQTTMESFLLLMRNDLRLSKLKCLRLNFASSAEDESMDQFMKISSKINQWIRRMPFLKHLGIRTPQFFEVTVDVPNSLKLRKLHLCGCGLVYTSGFENLEYLRLCKVKPNLVLDTFAAGRQFQKISELCLFCIDSMSAAFVDRVADGVPNCTILRTTLKIDSGSAALFTRLFLRLKKLTTLDLSLRVEDEEYCSPSHIASYFSGLTANEIDRIQGLPDEQLSYPDVGGITSLRDLRQLRMKTSLLQPRYPPEHHIPLADLLFRLTFLRMPYLRAIIVDGGFDISDGVIEQWTSLGKEFGLLDFHHEISQSSDDDESDNGSDIDDNDDSDDDGVINNNHENDLNEHADHDRNE